MKKSLKVMKTRNDCEIASKNPLASVVNQDICHHGLGMSQQASNRPALAKRKDLRKK